MIEEANKEASNNKFGNALSFINQGLANDPNNKELISLKNKYEKENDVIQAAQDKANAEAEAEKYKPKRITKSDWIVSSPPIRMFTKIIIIIV